MAETYVQVNIPTSAGKKLKAWDSVDGNLDTVYSEAVTLAESDGTELGTVANPLKVDGSGVTQPVIAAALPLPAGAATEATLAAQAADLASIDFAVTNLDTKTVHVDTNSVTVVASSLPAGAATEATLATRATEATLATRATEATLANRLADATFTGRINTQGQKTMAASTPVVIASDQSAIPVSGTVTVAQPVAVTGPLTNAELRATAVPTRRYSTTATRTAVAAASSDTQLLATNGNRVGALIYNDSNASLYVGLGSAAVSASDFTYLVAASTLWATPDGYVGEVRGIWVDSQGNARMTEMT